MGRRKFSSDTDDRISNLPNSILSHILSLMPTKKAMATCILSKRWKHLWTTTVNLDFCCPENYQGSVEQFVQFVNYALLLHKPGYLNRFSLLWETGCIPFYVNTWINAAAIRNVHELIVGGKISKLPIQVQECMFSCERLQSLELDCIICISSEIAVYLPRLERLKLRTVYFQSDKAFCNLLDGCPKLKSLAVEINLEKMVEDGYINKVNGIAFNVDGSEFKFVISSAFLKHLDLYVYGINLPMYQGLCSVELDASSLQSIILEGQIHSIFIKQKSLAFLDEANIQPIGLKSEEPNYFNSFVEAVRTCLCAKTLNLNHHVIRAISCATIKMKTKFNRLTRLDVNLDLNYWSSLQDFIKLSDHLEDLIIEKCPGYYVNGFYINNSNWETPNQVPRCVSNSLKTISISAYDGFSDELAMVVYLLKHGSALEAVKICFGESISDIKRKYKLLQQISISPRKSPICEVKFPEI